METKTNFFKKHKVLTVIMVLVVLIGLASAFGESGEKVTDSKKEKNTQTSKGEEKKEQESKSYKDGQYLVGYDLDPGTYKVEVTDTTTKMGYVERAKSVAMNMDDIIANELFEGQGYINIEKGDYAVRLQGVKIVLKK